MDGYQNNDPNGYQEDYNNGWGPQGQQGYYQNNQQNYYQNGAPYYQEPKRGRGWQDMEEPMTVGEWILTMLITAIPCVNVIMMLVWAFGSGAKRSKSNWAKAMLIVMLIGVILSVILAVTGVGMGIYQYYLYQYI